MSNAVDTSTAKSYLDFSGLETLRAKAEKNQKGALQETAQQFESMFIQMMMKSMREANSAFKDEENNSSARETFEDMYDKEVSVQMAKRNSLGVANFFEQTIGQRTMAAADVLKSREKNSGISLYPKSEPVSLQKTPQQSIPLTKPEIKTLKEVNMKRFDGGGS